MSHELLPHNLTLDKSKYWLHKILFRDSLVDKDSIFLTLDPQDLEMLEMGYSVHFTEHNNETHDFTGKSVVLGGINLRWSLQEAKKRLDKVDKIIEIGVSFGNNAWKMCRLFNPKDIYLVDPYTAVPENVFNNHTVGSSDVPMNFAMVLLSRFPCNKNFIRETSEVAVKRFDDNSIDFIYVDGDHSYEGCLKDIELYYPKLRKGGIMAGDDLHKDGVRPAVEKYFKEFEQSDNDYEWLVVK
jgi:hypothetical protein